MYKSYLLLFIQSSKVPDKNKNKNKNVFVFQVASRFVGSFQCDQECGHLQDEDLKTQCEQQFCEQLNDDEYKDYYDDDE